MQSDPTQQPPTQLERAYPAPQQATRPTPAVEAEPVHVPFVALREAAQEAAEAADQYAAARTRWLNAQAGLAEAQDRVQRAREAHGI